jgi:hypothetical protein
MEYCSNPSHVAACADSCLAISISVAPAPATTRGSNMCDKWGKTKWHCWCYIAYAYWFTYATRLRDKIDTQRTLGESLEGVNTIINCLLKVVQRVLWKYFQKWKPNGQKLRKYVHELNMEPSMNTIHTGGTSQYNCRNSTSLVGLLENGHRGVSKLYVTYMNSW